MSYEAPLPEFSDAEFDIQARRLFFAEQHPGQEPVFDQAIHALRLASGEITANVPLNHRPLEAYQPPMVEGVVRVPLEMRADHYASEHWDEQRRPVPRYDADNDNPSALDLRTHLYQLTGAVEVADERQASATGNRQPLGRIIRQGQFNGETVYFEESHQREPEHIGKPVVRLRIMTEAAANNTLLGLTTEQVVALQEETGLKPHQIRDWAKKRGVGRMMFENELTAARLIREAVPPQGRAAFNEFDSLARLAERAPRDPRVDQVHDQSHAEFVNQRSTPLQRVIGRKVLADNFKPDPSDNPGY